MKKFNLSLLIATGVSLIGSTCHATVQFENDLRGGAAPVITQPQPAVQQRFASNRDPSVMPEAVRKAIYQQPARDQNTSPGSKDRVRQADRMQKSVINDSNLIPAFYAAENEKKPESRGANPNARAVVDDAVPNGHSNQTLSSIVNAIDGLQRPPSRPNVQAHVNKTRDQPRRSQSEDAAVESDLEEVVAKEGKFDQGRLQLLLKKLAINTGIVMLFGVGFIFIAKQLYKRKQVAPVADETKIQIKSTLRLSPKSNLFLVQAGEQRLIVASDQTGIKSVVALTNSFDSTLESLAGLTEQDVNGMDTDNAKENALTDALDTYSLAMVGQQEKSRQPETAPELPSPQDEVDEVRLRMEAALREHGLKDLFLNSLVKTG